MKKLTLLIISLVATLNIYAQNADEIKSEILELSHKKWELMANKDATALKDIFHEQAVFVHMGGYWGTEQELTTIDRGFIHYKHADIQSEEVRIAENSVTLNSALTLTAMVGGREVITPFFVTEVYLKQDGVWKLTVLAFTSRPQMRANQE